MPEKAEKEYLMMWLPYRMYRPQKSTLSLDRTDPAKATLHYEETFENLTPELVQNSRQILKMLTAGLGTIPDDFKQEGNTISYTVTGNANMLAGMMATEYLCQSFSGNPEKPFWRLVDTLQHFLSTNHIPIRELYSQHFGTDLDEDPATPTPVTSVPAQCQKCTTASQVEKGYVSRNELFTCSNCRHTGKLEWRDSAMKEARF